jgi:hypothetical protein
MGLLDLWDYLRASGDARLRKQGYASSGMGILARYRRTAAFWAPHLENNRKRPKMPICKVKGVSGRLCRRGGATWPSA